ncbi:MAG: hypothetical protein HOI33_11345 [Rhodospirillaceae bacterium]|jgi:hypothetical protein|nr:hypothetical protein [Rhodospirillaceae bacterium]
MEAAGVFSEDSGGVQLVEHDFGGARIDTHRSSDSETIGAGVCGYRGDRAGANKLKIVSGHALDYHGAATDSSQLRSIRATVEPVILRRPILDRWSAPG